MGNAQFHPAQQRRPRAHGLRLRFPGDVVSVRQALKTAIAAFREMPIGDSLTGVVEIVLAEVFNNIVEHAFAEQRRGFVEVEVDLMTTALRFRVCDDGLPMPGGDAPRGKVCDLDVDDCDLPEGGFGWFLIRELTQDLSYRRIGDRNELTFRIGLDATAPGR